MVLALSDEKPSTVNKFLDREGFTVRTAAGSRSSGDYGVNGIPASFLVGPDGRLLWKGHPSKLSAAKLRSLLGDLKKPAEGDFLAVRPAPGARMHTSLETAVEDAEAGRLGAALEAARAVALDAEAKPGARAAAETLAREIETHVTLLETQAQEFEAAREPLPTRAILKGLATALTGTETGTQAQKHLDELAEDEEWKSELAGALALEAAVRDTVGVGSTESRRGFRAVVKEHAGTLAASRAKRRLQRK